MALWAILDQPRVNPPWCFSSVGHRPAAPFELRRACKLASPGTLVQRSGAPAHVPTSPCSCLLPYPWKGGQTFVPDGGGQQKHVSTIAQTGPLDQTIMLPNEYQHETYPKGQASGSPWRGSVLGNPSTSVCQVCLSASYRVAKVSSSYPTAGCKVCIRGQRAEDSSMALLHVIPTTWLASLAGAPNREAVWDCPKKNLSTAHWRPHPKLCPVGRRPSPRRLSQWYTIVRPPRRPCKP